MWILIALLLQLAAAIVYVPATIDSLGYVNDHYVVVEGIAGGTDRDDNVTSFRLLDSHGHHRKCVLPAGLDPPKAGAHIRVKGTRTYYPATGAAEIDPVYSITPVED